MRLGGRFDQDEREVDGAVHWGSMGPKLRHHGSSEFSDLDWIKYISGWTSKIRFQCCMSSNKWKFLTVYSCHSRTHWWESDSAWIVGSRRFSIQLERTLVSQKMFLQLYFNSQVRTHCWRKGEQRWKTNSFSHFSLRCLRTIQKKNNKATTSGNREKNIIEVSGNILRTLSIGLI